ncbi:MAG: hypothetical protein ACK4KW_03815 [Gemmobacter sp.]
MSAPRTNIETQRRRHFAPRTGIAIAVGFALLLGLIWAGWSAMRTETPRNPDAVTIDGRTGQPTETPPVGQVPHDEAPALPTPQPAPAPEIQLLPPRPTGD